MKFRLIIIVVGLFIFGAAGQAEGQTGWRIVTPANEEFSVNAPADFRSLSPEKLSNENEEHDYYIFQDFRWFYVFSNSPENPSQVEKVLKHIGLKPGKTLQNGKFRFKDESGKYHNLLVIKTQKRIYVFETVSETDNDIQVNPFFDSIRINGKPFNAKTLKTVAATPENENYGVPNSYYTTGSGGGQGTGRGTGVSNGTGTGNGMGTGNGTGTGSGNGIGTGSGDSSGGATYTPPKLSDEKLTQLKIISKPKGKYTDAARTNQVQGVVRLRVTFLANGTIGDISVISGLPDGLSETAKDAAKLIKFEPATRDGRPVTVVKVLEYPYTIY